MGSFSVLNNIASVNGQNQLNVNNINLARTLNRLSSGKRINSGADDAAGLQIADNLRGNVMALNQAARNANDGISFLQVADGALEQITNLLHRSVTLAEEAATGTMSSANRNALDQEFNAIKAEINRIANATNFNGKFVFLTDGDTAITNLTTKGSDATGLNKTLRVFVGDLTVNTTDVAYIAVSIGAIGLTADTSSVAGFNTSGLTNATLSDDTGNMNGEHAAAALTDIRNALTAVSTMRGTIGAGINRLQAAITVINAQSQNTLAAESAIRDANVAEEVSNLTKFQILAQTGIAALAQANTNSQNVLSLLR